MIMKPYKSVGPDEKLCLDHLITENTEQEENNENHRTTPINKS